MCGRELPSGTSSWLFGSHRYYTGKERYLCAEHVGFMASRYGTLELLGVLTTEEHAWKEVFDEEVRELIATGLAILEEVD